MEATDKAPTEPTDESLQRSFELADGLAEGFLNTCDSVCAVPSETADEGAVIYGLWARFTAQLTFLGWSPDELSRDARQIAEDQVAREDDDEADNEIGAPVGNA